MNTNSEKLDEQYRINELSSLLESYWPKNALISLYEVLNSEHIPPFIIQTKMERLPEHSGQFTPMDELNTEFEWWCGHNGHPIWSKRSFKKALKEREFKEGRQSSARGFDYLRIKTELTS